MRDYSKFIVKLPACPTKNIWGLPELRFASISILLSVLAYPIHYPNGEITLLPSVEISKRTNFKFIEFRQGFYTDIRDFQVICYL